MMQREAVAAYDVGRRDRATRRGWIVLALLLVVVGSAANAQPSVPASTAAAEHDWQGAYAGLSGGLGSGSTNRVEVLAGRVGDPVTSEFIGEIDSNRLQTEGGLGGVLAGYNFQRGHFVGGIETDFLVSGVSDSASCSAPVAFACNRGLTTLMEFRAEQDIDWVGTLRARAGGAAGKSLFYVTGGVAFAKAEYEIGLEFDPFLDDLQGTIRRSATLNGYAIGAGAERAAGRRWTARLEYQYLDFGEERLRGRGFDFEGNHVVDFVADLETKLHVARAAVTSRF